MEKLIKKNNLTLLVPNIKCSQHKHLYSCHFLAREICFRSEYADTDSQKRTMRKRVRLVPMFLHCECESGLP